MKLNKRIIALLIGFAVIGSLTYYLLTNEKEKAAVTTETPITNPEQDTVATAQVIQEDTMSFEKIQKALNIDGEEFKLTKVKGVYTNTAKDKVLIIKEDVWKKMIQKIQEKLPTIAEDCYTKEKMPNLKEYKFVGLLTYFTDSKDSKITTAYKAIEIRNGKAKTFAGGGICCDCEGEPLITQQTDAVIDK
jgi:hypothetical protein